MNKFLARFAALLQRLFGNSAEAIVLPKIEMPEVKPTPVEEEPSKFQTNPVVNTPGYTLVAVRPTGPRGIGKVRFYPMASMDPRENLFGYLVNLADTIDVTNGKPFLNAQAKAEIANLMLNPGGLPRNPADWPAYADALNFSEDWRTQAQWDAIEKEKGAWNDWNNRMQDKPDSGDGGSV